MRYLCVFPLLALTLPAAAAPPARDIELTPIAGYRGGGGFEDTGNGESLDLDESASYGLVLNIDHDANTQWEFMFSRQNTSLKPGPTAAPGFDLDVTHFSAGGIYVWRDEKVEPFIGAGLGVTHMSPDGSGYDDETRVMFQFNGGYKFWLTRNIGLRLELRGYTTFMDSDAAVFCAGGACVAKVESTGFGQLEGNVGLSVRF
ncbi:MAG: hypothetical protein CMN57_04615 [Gammaproteobacteria bacterium]|nr:hypothetical protein [Gammaproteobacteria bacterium]